MKRSLAALTATAAALAVAGPAVAGFGGWPTVASAPVYIYGVGSQNRIWQVDPANQTPGALVNDTGLLTTDASNSMAYDTARDQFMWTYNGASGAGIRFWDRQATGAGSVPLVATLAQAGITGTDPANAAYYDNAFWYVQANAQVLHQVKFTYDAAAHPTFVQDITYNLASYAAPVYPAGLGYGDIAIDANTATLYGVTTSGLFYRLDLNALGSTANTVYTQIATGVGSLQLSFDPTYTTLYGQEYGNTAGSVAGRWFTLDTTTGARADTGYRFVVPGTAYGFRDLGGASTTKAFSTCEITQPGMADGQRAQVGTAVRHAPGVRIVTSIGEPEPGVNIAFTVVAGGGTVGGATRVVVQTDAQGIATAPDWVMGPDPGANAVTATDDGSLCNHRFTATGTAGPVTPSDDPVEPQKPVHPPALPPTVHPGTNTITDGPIRTNAGQVARVRVTCTIASTGAPAPRGRCTTYTVGTSLRLRVTCGPEVRVRVVISAPAAGDFAAYRKVRTYLASGNCAVTG